MSESKISFTNQLVDFDTLISKIEAGEYLVIAADESILKRLPSGNWIAGTIPYFMAEQGGMVSREDIYVNTINGVQSNRPPRIMLYDSHSISRIAHDAPEHGFTITILPFMSDVHTNYAKNAPEFPNMYFTPIIGWIAGRHLEDDDASQAKTGFGPAGNMLMEQQAVAMHIPLPDSQIANINIVNLFEESDGPKITFSDTGFSVGQCYVDGQPTTLAQYIADNNIDTRLPLVADYSGVKVNVSIQHIDNATQQVGLYAPVFSDLNYQFAKPFNNYVEEFGRALSESESSNIAFSCNCILNYLYSELEGKTTGKLTGPFTFGEVAYQLLNQTLVYMTLETDR